MPGFLVRLLPYALAFSGSFCIMILELVSSRLVARHVGASLAVWTSVIGIILGGICLGNVLGGRLADRVEPRRAVGPLFALSAFLTLSCIWINAELARLLPLMEGLSWELRTVVVVTLDFLVPATVLGMVGPVVAKMAVEETRKAGSAIGDVYFCGAVGSIAGTFVAGFILTPLAPTSVIVQVVGAILALLAAGLIGSRVGVALGLVTAVFLGLGSTAPVVRSLGVVSLNSGGMPINLLLAVGNVSAVLLAIAGVVELLKARAGTGAVVTAGDLGPSPMEEAARRPGLADLAVLSFIASMTFMALEMVAGRMVSRHLGSSIYGWTSVIGVLLAGLSLGNFLGGKIADFVKSEKHASWLFLIASVLTLSILLLESPPRWLLNSVDLDDSRGVLNRAVTLTEMTLPGGMVVPLSWPYRVLLVVTAVFFLPALTMGTFSPVVAKLAVDRLKSYKRTGTAIGEVYAWGMVGSILGTFLTGFVFIDVLGVKGVLLLVGTVLAFAATVLGSVWHAVWAGIPLGLCVIAFAPIPYLEEIGLKWNVRQAHGDPDITGDGLAWVDESDYYFIKVTNEPEPGGLLRRTLVLDNLIHGYFILGHPERLDYTYEHIYALVADRAAKAYNRITLAKTADQKPDAEAASKPDDAKRDADKAETPESDKPKVVSSKLTSLFLGGGAYAFQRYMQHTYPGTEVDVAEIDRAVTNANHRATGLPEKTPIVTYWGDARQFVERNQDSKQYDLVFGDAFNDFSVPWHLTTLEFNEMINKMLSPTGIYMINIIDVYRSDKTALRDAEAEIRKRKITDAAEQEQVRAAALAEAHRVGGFLGSWTKTARKTFPHVYIFGTDATPGHGLRETFVVVACKQPLDLAELGKRPDDPEFFVDDERTEPVPFGPKDEAEVDARARGIILTDDYAPVENLLAPVAKTRGDD
jgi:MFS family permease